MIHRFAELALLASLAVACSPLESESTELDLPALTSLNELRVLGQKALDEGDFTRARRIAEIIVDYTRKGPRDWRRGNAHHHGYRLLGLAAVREGRVEEAKGHLLDSGLTSGSPQLNSFGPNMQLAKELLERGESAVVLKYLALCRRFWNQPKLARWEEQIRAGEVPDFGAHLVYGSAPPLGERGDGHGIDTASPTDSP